MFGLSLQELIVILIIFLLLFGSKRIPEIARAFGKAIREFKKATEEDSDKNMIESKEDSQKQNNQNLIEPENKLTKK